MYPVNPDIAEAIQRSTGWYNHVAIFFAGWIYHATSKRGVIKEPIDQFLQVDECYAVYACSDIDVKAVWKEQSNIFINLIIIALSRYDRLLLF